MSARVSPFERQEHNPSAQATSPAGEAIARRAHSRVGHGRGVIPPEAAEGLPGRIARLAYGRLPLLDALQRRWISSAAAWPDASDLPLVTGSARPREVEMAFRGGEARPYPASSGGTLPVAQTRPASDDRTIPDHLPGRAEGEGGPPAAQPDVAGAAPRLTRGSGLVEAQGTLAGRQSQPVTGAAAGQHIAR